MDALIFYNDLVGYSAYSYKRNFLLKQFYSKGVNEFVDSTVKRMLPVDYSQRSKQIEDEMNELIGKKQMCNIYHP